MHFECAPEIPEILLSFPILLHLMYFVLLIAIYYEIACPIFRWSSYLVSNSKFADALILLILQKFVYAFWNLVKLDVSKT